MFCNKKWLFFIISCLMSAVVSYFVDLQTSLLGISQGWLVGWGMLFVLDSFVSFALAVVLALIIVKGIYQLWVYAAESIAKKVFWRWVWVLYTIIVYLSYALLFLWVTRY
ncbi:MAG: hypothetical protein LBC07_01085 [Elusimicrobiota bacterium]|jgi:hypothetical protein|nr:hypothetical protein [Elusimicrobiota bacterium]